MQSNGLLDPEEHVIASAAQVVAKVVVEADGTNLTGLEQGNGLVGPIDPSPASGSGALIVEKNEHGGDD
jgi:hypothetical protein